MPKPAAGVGGSTMAGHLANTQRAHDGTSVCRPPAYDLDIRHSAAKAFQFSPQAEYLIERRSVSCARPLCIFAPRPAKNMRGKYDACRRSVGKCLGGIAIFRPGQDRQFHFDRRPTCAFFVIAKQRERQLRTASAELHKFCTLS